MDFQNSLIRLPIFTATAQHPERGWLQLYTYNLICPTGLERNWKKKPNTNKTTTTLKYKERKQRQGNGSRLEWTKGDVENKVLLWRRAGLARDGNEEKKKEIMLIDHLLVSYFPQQRKLQMPKNEGGVFLLIFKADSC